MKRSIHLLAILAVVIFGLALVNGVDALEYKSENVNVQFTYEPTLSLTTPGNISITVAPGAKAVSASTAVATVSTNNAKGYTLSATVGCATAGSGCYNSKELSDGTHSFSMVSSTTALTAGTWGISTSSSATATSNFSPLALHNATATVLNKTTNAGGTAASGYAGTANTTFRVGVYATASQVAGSYSNKVNFIAVANT